MSNTSYNIIIYTDGACRGNPGPGGWGAYIIKNNISFKLSGNESLTTNNRMELLATISSLEYFKKKNTILIYTDSMYVKNGITIWISSWIKNGWKTSSKKCVKNFDLWKRLHIQNNYHEITWKWVKGHAGVEGNEIADSLATNAIEEL